MRIERFLANMMNFPRSLNNEKKGPSFYAFFEFPVVDQTMECPLCILDAVIRATPQTTLVYNISPTTTASISTINQGLSFFHSRSFAKIVTKKGITYIGNQYMVLDENYNVLCMPVCTLSKDSLGNITYGKTYLDISDKVLENRANPFEKNVLNKIIPMLHDPYYCQFKSDYDKVTVRIKEYDYMIIKPTYPNINFLENGANSVVTASMI